MISATGSDPGDEVPEADWAEQQVETEPDHDQHPAQPGLHSSTAEADPADLADQDFEVDLDEV